MNDDRIDQIIEDHQSEASSLIQVLLDIQNFTSAWALPVMFVVRGGS